MTFPWPAGFERVPDEDWTREPVEELALKYDTVENHGWYSNLDHTVEQIGEYARRGDILVDVLDLHHLRAAAPRRLTIVRRCRGRGCATGQR